ncbi:mavicyanin-like [Actinidia eriantha]|uniref:mavicyanin-like n=1 Tax=Actinidia eriantha TaxID=165200 RepID=UPI002583077E|nr:mavicyanin-like [Actinidia eriantha]
MGFSGFFRALALVTIFGTLLVSKSMAVVYKVGDSTGWTTIGNFDYKQWAATKTFQIGDVILFQYSPQFHNVMQVTHPDYQSCNASNPIATHTTGNDSITITNYGHHFFLCGVPGHCQSGQKVDINVLRAALVPTPSVSPTPTPDATVPATPPSGAATLDAMAGLLRKLGFSMAVFAAFVSVLA